MPITRLLLALTAALIAAPALAQPGVTLDSQSIIVNPARSDLNVRVWLNRDPQGQGTATYKIGDSIRVGVQVSQDAYVYLFGVNSQGEISLFVPNGYDGPRGNFVRAGTRTVFPGQGAEYTLTVGGPRGQDRILALASRTPLDLTEIASVAGEQGFSSVTVQGEAQLGEVLSGAVSTLGPQDWVSTVLYYGVGVRGQGNPQTGNSQTGNSQTGNPQTTDAVTVITPQPEIQPTAPQPEPQPSTPAPAQPVSTIQPGERQGGSIDSAIKEAFDRTSGAEALGQATTYVERWGNGAQQKFSGVAAYGKAVILHADGSERSYAVHGRILERYLALSQAESGNRPPSRLGWAAGDEKIIPRNLYATSGLYGFFQSGALYCTEKFGTFWLVGDLLRKYQAVGGSGSILGFPTRDQYQLSGHWAADFEGGKIRYQNGAYVVIRK
jgi:uncharacterized protein with LGFP repeats